jgi:hypothetical protein
LPVSSTEYRSASSPRRQPRISQSSTRSGDLERPPEKRS